VGRVRATAMMMTHGRSGAVLATNDKGRIMTGETATTILAGPSAIATVVNAIERAGTPSRATCVCRVGRSASWFATAIVSTPCAALKSEDQRWLHERDKDHDDYDGHPDRTPDEIREWAYEHDLPYFDDEVHFPDVELESPLHPATIGELQWYFEHRDKATREPMHPQDQGFLDVGARVFGAHGSRRCTVDG
jgi:hypothetical protein